MKNFILSPLGVLALALLLILAGGFSLMNRNGSLPLPTLPPMPGQGGVACTAEAMQCPDGTYVGRTGPNCQFVCPNGSSTSPTPPPVPTPTPGAGGILPYNSGIEGTVMAGPTCPVERTPPDPQCADKPIQTNISIFRASDIQHGVAFQTSDSKGAFKISLPPGNYVVMAGSNGVPYPRCQDASATVGPSGYAHVSISCDTGIR